MPETTSRYRVLNDAAFDLYAQGRLTDAIALIEDAPPDVAHAYASETAYLLACLWGALGEPARGLAALEEAAKHGGWWNPDALLKDDDLAGLRELAEFKVLLDRVRPSWEAGNRQGDRSGDRLLRPMGTPRGVLVALHGAEQGADDAAAAWSAATREGYVVLAVRSSTRTSPRYRTWGPDDVSARDIRHAIEHHLDHHRELPLYAGGFSAGGRIALHWALTSRPVPVRGVLAVAPALRPDELPTERSATSARIVVGEDDDQVRDECRSAAEILGETVAIEEVPSLGHDYPGDFTERLRGWLRPQPPTH